MRRRSVHTVKGKTPQCSTPGSEVKGRVVVARLSDVIWSRVRIGLPNDVTPPVTMDKVQPLRLLPLIDSSPVLNTRECLQLSAVYSGQSALLTASGVLRVVRHRLPYAYPESNTGNHSRYTKRPTTKLIVLVFQRL